MTSPSKPLIAVPVHIMDGGHCENFVTTIRNLQIYGADQYPWYLDVNGCPPDINTAIQSSFGSDYPNIHVHIELSGGRPSAMNRALYHARTKNATSPYIIFTNDDLGYDIRKLPFDPLVAGLQSGRALVGAISAPADLDFRKYPNDKRYQLSTSLVAEHFFYEKMQAQRGHHFRGDCFGMQTNLITEFPLGIAADDTFLSLVYQAKYGSLPFIVEDAQVTREQEMTVGGSTSRLMRYFDGRGRLIKFLEEDSHDPVFAEAHKIAVKSLHLATPETLIQAEERFRQARVVHDPELLRSAVQRHDYSEARSVYGPLADATVFRAAVRRVVRGEGATGTSESGEVTWSRSTQRK